MVLTFRYHLVFKVLKMRLDGQTLGLEPSSSTRVPDILLLRLSLYQPVKLHLFVLVELRSLDRLHMLELQGYLALHSPLLSLLLQRTNVSMLELSFKYLFFDLGSALLSLTCP